MYEQVCSQCKVKGHHSIPCSTGTKKSPSRKLCTWMDGEVMGTMDTVVQSELWVNCTPLQFAYPKSNLLAKSVLDEAGLVRISEIYLFAHRLSR